MASRRSYAGLAERPRDHNLVGCPRLAAVDLRALSWHERQRLELLAQAFDVPLELSPLVEQSRGLVDQMQDGRVEGIVLKDRTGPYRDGSPAGWAKVKDRSWYERERVAVRTEVTAGTTPD